MEPEQDRILEIVAAILDRLEIPYFVTGGIAVTVWGRPRFTADIDIVAELLPQNLDKLAAELLQIDKYVYVDRDTMQEALEQQGEFNFIHSTSGVKVDFWVKRNDQRARQQMNRKIEKKINDQVIFFISPEDLILSKLLWYKESESTKQLEDIESILEIQRELDFEYLKKQAQIQSTLEILKSLPNNQNGK